MSHVYPFKFDYLLPANHQFAERVVSIQVSFTSHAFTRGCVAGEVQLPEGIPDDSEYWVFFFLERADKGVEYLLHLIVQSGYVGQHDRSPAGRTAKKITFRTLVAKVLAGEKPKPPP